MPSPSLLLLSLVATNKNPKTVKKMMKLIILFCGLSFVGLSQELKIKYPEENIIPDPHNDIYTLDANDYSKVKSIMSIRKIKRNDGFRIDTLSIDYYRNSLKVKTTHFPLIKTLPIKETKWFYNDNKTLKSYLWEDHDYYLETFYEYDRKQRIIRTDKKMYKKWGNKDTIKIQSKIYEYVDNKLVMIIQNAYEKASYSHKYEYKNNLLYRNNDGAFLYTYEYDRHNNLIKITTNFPIVESVEIGIKIFEYNKQNQLVKEFTKSDNNGLKGLTQLSTYEYDENNQLKVMNVTYDTLFRNAVYEYENYKIKTITILHFAKR